MESEEKKHSTLKSNSEQETPRITESFFNDIISVKQPEKGYRFSIDALLLAYQVNPHPGQRILDLGTGCGIIALILARRFPDLKIYGIEIQSSMAQLAHLNVFENKLEEQIKIICADMKCLYPTDIEGSVDMVVVNPPFGKSGHSRKGHNMAKSVAKHEIFATLSDVIEFSMRVLKRSGALLIIYPTQRLIELLYTLRSAKLEPKWLRTVHPHYHSNANRVIVRAVKHGRAGMTIGPPLYVHGENGSYTPEVEKMFQL